MAFGHGKFTEFSTEGIKYCLQYFQKMGYHAKAVVPLYRRDRFKSSNPELINQLNREGKIVFAPFNEMPGQGSVYEDHFILQLAHLWNAVVVSNRDLFAENPTFGKIVRTRVIGYSWCDSIFILPKDPYGRWGPKLDDILQW